MSTEETTAASFPAWLGEHWAPLLAGTGAAAPDPLDDADRLSAVDALRADDVDRVQALTGDLVARAAAETGAPVGLLNVVLTGSQVIASASGLTGWLAEARATPAEWSLCATVVRTGAAYVVPDFSADPSTADNPLWTVDGLRSYAGVPLTTSDGQVIGAVCVLGTEPREFSDADLDVLRDVAARSVRRLEEAAGTAAEPVA